MTFKTSNTVLLFRGFKEIHRICYHFLIHVDMLFILILLYDMIRGAH